MYSTLYVYNDVKYGTMSSSKERLEKKKVIDWVSIKLIICKSQDQMGKMSMNWPVVLYINMDTQFQHHHFQIKSLFLF